MELKIYWTDFSKSELHKIFDYYKEKVSLKIATQLVIEINQEVKKLQSQPSIGQREELLIDRKQEFRYFIHKNFKMIYWINIKENRIEITDVFDTRQNPEKIKRTK